MVKEYTYILMVLGMKASGRMICSMDKVLKLGLMAQNMKGSTNKERNTDLENTNGMTDPDMKESG